MIQTDVLHCAANLDEPLVSTLQRFVGLPLSLTRSVLSAVKCGHGGSSDDKQDFSPTGGINKETSDPLLSPHHHLHQQAAELAVQATRDFFVGAGKSRFGGLQICGVGATTGYGRQH